MSGVVTPDMTPEAKAAALAQAQAFSARTVWTPLGIRMVDVAYDWIEIEMPISDASRQPMGLLHGGVSMVLAESAASLHCALTVDILRVAPVGVDINGTHIRSATEGTVVARGEVIRRTRTLVFHEIRLTLRETGQLLCIARVTNLLRPVGEGLSRT